MSDSNGKYSQSKCIEALRRYRKETGEVPSRSGYQRWCAGKGVPSTTAILTSLAGNRRKAEWKTVLQAAGMDGETVERRRRKKISRFDRSSCSSAIQQCISELGRVPNSTEYEQWRRNNPGQPSYLTVVRLGDSRFPKRQRWHCALRGLGFRKGLPERDYSQVRIGQERDREELVAAVLLCASEVGDVPSSYVYDRFAESQISEATCSDTVGLPTSTTLRRRLGGGEGKSGGKWCEVLAACGLDPSKQCAKKTRNFRKTQRHRCVSAIHEFAELFGGFATVPAYTRWALLDEKRPSLATVLHWLSPEKRSWSDVGKRVFGKNCRHVKVTREQVEALRLPQLAPRRDCIAALRLCRAECNNTLPSFLGYRLWRRRKGEQSFPSESEILCQLSPEGGTWSTALANANGELSLKPNRRLKATQCGKLKHSRKMVPRAAKRKYSETKTAR